jgi:lysozyme
MPLNNEQIAKLEEHEGFRNRVYKCTAGMDTIGIGYNLIANPLKLSKVEIKSLYDVGITREKAVQYAKLVCNQVEADLRKHLNWFDDLDSNTQFVLINMGFQMGSAGVLGFKTTLGLIKEGKYNEASLQMLKSKWAKQTPNRAKDVARILRTGKL